MIFDSHSYASLQMWEGSQPTVRKQINAVESVLSATKLVVEHRAFTRAKHVQMNSSKCIRFLLKFIWISYVTAKEEGTT